MKTPLKSRLFLDWLGRIVIEDYEGSRIMFEQCDEVVAIVLDHATQKVRDKLEAEDFQMLIDKESLTSHLKELVSLLEEDE